MLIFHMLTSFMPVMPLVVALYYYRQLRSFSMKIFAGYLGYAVLTETAAWIIWLKGQSNHLVYNLYDIATMSVMAVLWSQQIRGYRKLLLLPFVLIPITGLLASTPLEFNTGNYFVVCLFQGVFAAYSLINLVDHTDEPIGSGFFFWLYSGLLLYAFSTLNIYLLFDYALKKSGWGLRYYQVYNFLMAVIANSMYAKAFLCLKKTPQYSLH